MNTSSLLIRSFIRSAVDSCILPGAFAGSEITWLYFQQWKKEVSACCLAIAYLLMTQMTVSQNLRMLQQPLSKSENIQ